MADTNEILNRIDKALKDNKRTEYIFLILTIILFLSGIACIWYAIIVGELPWATPSMITTGLIYFPLKEIKLLRDKNVALAIAPIIITQLPPAKAAEEIQKLLEHLYGKKDAK
jgi:hypothetical protein